MNTSKTTSMILAAAVAGMMTGATASATFASDSGKAVAGKAGVKAPSTEKLGCSGKEGCGAKKGDKATCKGKNDCKGKGGCKSSDNGCKGKNSCKGKGGCNGGKKSEDKKTEEKPAETPAK